MDYIIVTQKKGKEKKEKQEKLGFICNKHLKFGEGEGWFFGGVRSKNAVS